MKEYNKQEFKKYNYVLGLDIYDEGAKKYKGFNTLNDVNKYIENSPNYKYFYQVIRNDKTKIFFDIDLKDDYFTRAKFDNYLKIIKIQLTTFFNIKDPELYITYKKLDNDKFNSVHIIITNYYTTKSNIKLFINYLINTFKFDFLDDKIYTKNRFFSLNNNGKKNKDTIFESYDNKYFNILNEWCDNIKGLKYVEPNKGYLIDTSFKNDNNINHNNIYKINILDDELYQYIKVNLIDKFYSSKDWKRLLLYLHNIFELNDKEGIIDDYLNYSSKKDNTYTYEKNLTYYNTYTKKYNFTLSTYTTTHLIKLLNKYSNVHFKLIEQTKNNIINLISNNTKININELQKIINIDNCTKNIIKLNDKYEYNKKLDILIDNNNNVINLNDYNKWFNNDDMNFDIIFNDDKTKDQLINDFNNNVFNIFVVSALWGSGKSYHIMRPIIDHLLLTNKDSKILMITERNSLNSQVFTDYKNKGFVSHLGRRRFNKDDHLIIVSMESLYKVGLKTFDLIILDEYESIITNLDSDTMETQYKSYYKGYETLAHYINTSKKCLLLDADISKNRIKHFKELRTNKDDKYKIVKYNINKFSDYNYNIYLQSLKLFKKNLFNDIENNKKIVLSSTSVKTVNLYYEYIKSITKNNVLLINGEGAYTNTIKKYYYTIIKLKEVSIKQINYSLYKYDLNIDNFDDLPHYIKLNESKKELKILKEINNDKTPAQLKDLILNDIDKYIETNKIKILIFSPTLLTGVNIKTEFDKHYNIASNGSISVRQLLQQLHRTRLLKDKQFNLYIKGTPKINYNRHNLNIIKKYLLSQKLIYDKKNYLKGIFNLSNDDYEDIKEDLTYLEVKANNRLEKELSRSYFLQLFIYKTSSNNDNVKLIISKSNIDNVNDNFKELSAIIDNDRITKLINTDLITKTEFDTYKRLDDNNISESDQLELTKYYLLSTYNITAFKEYQYYNEQIKLNNKSVILWTGDITFNKSICDESTKFKIVNEYNKYISTFLNISFNGYDYNTKISNIELVDKYINIICNELKINKDTSINIYEFIKYKHIKDRTYYDLNPDKYKLDTGNNYTDVINNKLIKFNTLGKVLHEYFNIICFNEFNKRYKQIINDYEYYNNPVIIAQLINPSFKSKYRLLKSMYNKFNDYEYTKDKDKINSIKSLLIKNLLQTLNIDITKKTYYTNELFFNHIKNNMSSLIEIEEDINNFHEYTFNISCPNAFKNNKIFSDESFNKKKLKIIITKLNQLLSNINVGINYTDINDNTTRLTSKLIIAQKNELINIKKNQVNLNDSNDDYKSEINQLYLYDDYKKLDNDFETEPYKRGFRCKHSKRLLYKHNIIKWIDNKPIPSIIFRPYSSRKLKKVKITKVKLINDDLKNEYYQTYQNIKYIDSDQNIKKINLINNEYIPLCILILHSRDYENELFKKNFKLGAPIINIDKVENKYNNDRDDENIIKRFTNKFIQTNNIYNFVNNIIDDVFNNAFNIINDNNTSNNNNNLFVDTSNNNNNIINVY